MVMDNIVCLTIIVVLFFCMILIIVCFLYFESELYLISLTP
jgi:hypothetical protein